MKELTPSGWIGVLIGIVVFGSLVGHVAAQKKCWQKDASSAGLENAEALKKAFDRINWIPTCDGTDLCLQYFPKSLTTGKVKAYMQCGASCGNPNEVTTAMTTILGAKNNDEYECSACDSVSQSACKDLAAVTKGSNTAPGKKCYSLAEPQEKASATPKSAPQIFCLDNCQGVTRTDGKVFVGCASDCATKKDAAVNCKDCENQECEKLIFKPPMCFRKLADQKLETVKLITDAYSTSNWKESCDYNQVCLQYYPEAGGATGKVSLQVECGASTCPAKAGYHCHACDSRDSDSCKKIPDVKSTFKECFESDNEKQTGDSALIAKIYCFDNCQYKEAGTKVKVGCAKDVTGTDCPATTDPSCAKMIFKPTDPIHSAGTTIPPGGNQATTTRPKTSNKLTISKYLLGSLAILLFATNQYMHQF